MKTDRSCSSLRRLVGLHPQDGGSKRRDARAPPIGDATGYPTFLRVPHGRKSSSICRAESSIIIKPHTDAAQSSYFRRHTTENHRKKRRFSLIMPSIPDDWHAVHSG